MAARYVPERGDFIWLDLSPTRGHEQAGYRPALVLSPRSYNRKTGLCVICAATRQQKGYWFEVINVQEPEASSVILADHVRCVDWRRRRARRIRRVPPNVLNEVVARLASLIIEPTE